MLAVILQKQFFIPMRIWLITGVLFLFNFHGYTQAINELRARKENIIKEIEYTTLLLNDVEKNRRTSLNQLQLLNNKIDQRNDLISAISNEILVYEECISNNELVISMLQSDLKQIKNEYAEMIRSAYLNKNVSDQLLFILSADDFNQVYRRYLYLKQYTAYRRNQVKIMQSLEEVLKQKSADLKQQNQIKQELVFQTTEEKEKLQIEKTQQTTELQKLQTQKSNLQQKLLQQQKEEQELENEIQRIINEESGNAGDDNNSIFVLTPEQKQIGENFKQNKKHLPWPVERGIITEHFGIHQHPVLTNVEIRNNGINIATEAGSKVNAVFNGEVSRVFGITGGNVAVIIRHGEYLTVYSNLSKVIVKKGDKVTAKQEIGTVYTDIDEQKSVLKFQIWLENQKLDPEDWIGQ